MRTNKVEICGVDTSMLKTLTEEEKKEQDLLRKEYIASFRKNLKAQLDNIDIVNEDGTVENLGEKYGTKKKYS